MRARFRTIPLAFWLLVGVLLSVLAFASLHHGASTQTPSNPVTASIGYQIAAPGLIEKFTPVTATQAVPLGAQARVAATKTKLRLIPPPPRGPRGPSQLIRTAAISIEVTDVTKALRTATSLTEEQLGDVIGLNDASPPSQNDAHTATMQIRVPQYRFEQTLDGLSQLGKVKSKSVNAQDVADQIIDAQARLRNLRRTEADILNIMDRSGNIEQVLNVTQELSSVREQIETLDAQVKGMQYQVAYSTINVSFISPPVITAPTGFALLGDAWKSAIDSLKNLTVGLLSAALWLVAFSPYVLLLVLLVALVLHRVRLKTGVPTSP